MDLRWEWQSQPCFNVLFVSSYSSDDRNETFHRTICYTKVVVYHTTVIPLNKQLMLRFDQKSHCSGSWGKLSEGSVAPLELIVGLDPDLKEESGELKLLILESVQLENRIV